MYIYIYGERERERERMFEDFTVYLQIVLMSRKCVCKGIYR